MTEQLSWPYLIIILALIGVFSSMLASTIGLGGGLTAIPLIMLAIGGHSLEAKLLSYCSIIALSLVATSKYYRQKRQPEWVKSFFILLGVIPITAICQIYLGPLLGTVALKPYFHFLYALLVIIVILIVNFKNQLRPRHLSNLNLFFSGLVIGFLSGSFGLSGGVFFIPLLLIGLNMKLKDAVVTSLFLKLGTSLVNVVAGIASMQFHKFASSGIPWFAPLLIISGALLGSQIGPRLNKLFSNRSINHIFNITLFVIFIWEIINGALVLGGIINEN